MPAKFSADEIAARIGALDGWAAGEDVITRSFTFKDHVEAMGFVVRVAMAAEVADHHPDLRIVYNRVEIRLNSHDAGGVTERDIRLAGTLDALV
jgi:4a-hydroxytetrahydrobiopterin dehydratase